MSRTRNTFLVALLLFFSLQLIDRIIICNYNFSLNTSYVWGIYNFGLVPLLLTLILIILLGSYYFRSKSIYLFIALMCAISNLVERAIYGGVVDYLRIPPFYFNFSDMGIVVGIALYFLKSFRSENKTPS
ncbi:MAG TPA: signal peptidase II [bacterium]|nr:signal peptidase II [bacterium]